MQVEKYSFLAGYTTSATVLTIHPFCSSELPLEVPYKGPKYRKVIQRQQFTFKNYIVKIKNGDTLQKKPANIKWSIEVILCVSVMYYKYH